MARRLKCYGLHVNGSASIATTGNTDMYAIVPKSGNVVGAYVVTSTTLAADDTNYITFTITNLGQAGSGSAAVLAATAPNTTQATGGTGLTANTKRTLTPNATAANVAVVEGDTLRIRAASTGTLGAANTLPRYAILIDANGQ